MAKKFNIYAQVRSNRQAAGDIHNAMLEKKGWNNAETIQWARIEEKLNDVEIMMESMDLKEDEVPHE